MKRTLLVLLLLFAALELSATDYYDGIYLGDDLCTGSGGFVCKTHPSIAVWIHDDGTVEVFRGAVVPGRHNPVTGEATVVKRVVLR